MFVIANLLLALASVLRIMIVFFELCIIISALLSFIMPFQYSKIRVFIDSSANIILNPIRKFIPTVIGSIDFSPMIAFLILFFLDRFLVQSLLELGYLLR
ncbi:hypothetical protein PW5551_06975 [Petrotoga sp. 9PW.55.5.1]|uniref:YggT family protein n=1 Tax=Petrotoga sp. 9PW.55.5.1 TaxID=1308979 RepID=UPI000DC2E588|nr:YggT family protein [Petrotoga sp. 9PW.55.5.1]RAO98934.1 hypothetical protein PW5551_06975 [Petrotoga sp. 9PW.55.5.1]